MTTQDIINRLELIKLMERRYDLMERRYDAIEALILDLEIDLRRQKEGKVITEARV